MAVTLDARKQMVLRAIVEDFVHSGDPVGSRTVARRYVLGVSPATIRNEMADLEDLGYLEQPHTSAGRIPSDKGYRFYVDRLMEKPTLQSEQMGRIRSLFDQRMRGVEWLVQETARLLSDVTAQVSLAMGPRLTSLGLRELRIMPLDEGRVLLLMVTRGGMVAHRVIEVPEGLSIEELERLTSGFSQRLAGVDVSTFGHDVLEEIAREFSLRRRILDEMIDFLEGASAIQERVVLGGATNMLRFPEFRDMERMQDVLALFEQEALLQEVLQSPLVGEGATVVIGHENRLPMARDCALVTAIYRVGGQEVGRVGVLGPKRMDYGRIVAIVEAVARSLGEALSS